MDALQKVLQVAIAANRIIMQGNAYLRVIQERLQTATTNAWTVIRYAWMVVLVKQTSAQDVMG